MTALFSRDHRRAMGVECVVSISGPKSPVLVQRCLDAVEELEQLWSRFLPQSDISRLNSANGVPIWVDPRTITLVQHMVSAHSATQGAFNPTLLPLQMAAGDTRSLVDDKTSHIPEGSQLSCDLSEITAHPDGRLGLPASLTLDAGGIAKGVAADMVVALAKQWGATDACINIGGDMAVTTSTDSGWNVDILSPTTRDVIDTVAVKEGGIATSSIAARNHNGLMLDSHIFSSSEQHTICSSGASVIAHSAAWAEAWTKFAILNPPTIAIQEMEAIGLAALIVDHKGTIFRTDSWKDFVL